MLDILRALRLGGLSIFGVTIPGLLLLGLFVGGFVLPAVLLAGSLAGGNFGLLAALVKGHTGALAIVVVVVGYSLGYVLRLYSPDDLDAASGKLVIARMQDGERDVWPFTGCPQDKFPYFNTHSYLVARNLTDEAKLASWGPDDTCYSKHPCDFHKGLESKKNCTTHEKAASQNAGKRSKTAVNRLKLQIALSNDEFATQAESHEAHIRLMSGAWRAIKWTHWPVLAGAMISVAGLVIALLRSPQTLVEARADFAVLAVLDVVLFGAVWWLRKRIESVFHYRRVGELLYVLQAGAVVRSRQKQGRKHRRRDIGLQPSQAARTRLNHRRG